VSAATSRSQREMGEDAGVTTVERGRGCRGSLQDRMWALEVKVLCERGKSAVGAEISGPALPRFTSGVGSCEDAQGGCFARTTAQEASVQFRRILLDLLVWP
jgi:hypothetical protein